VHDWKLLLEGSEYKVDVKNAPDPILGRMPFFFTSNHDVWKYGTALRERIIFHRFYTQINNDPQTAHQEGSPLLPPLSHPRMFTTSSHGTFNEFSCETRQGVHLTKTLLKLS
jgi:hypothetical protein